MGIHKKGDTLLETMDQSAELRRKQAESIVRRYAGEKTPRLIVGDMNEGPEDAALSTLEKAGFAHSCRGSTECGATFPGATSFTPAVFEIDHILGRGVTFRSGRVIRDGGSDHFPVFAEFIIKG